MVSAIKLSFHRRLFVLLIAFSWSIILCFIGFQYLREKQYKSDYLSLQLQLYNRHLLEAVEQDGEQVFYTVERNHVLANDGIATLAADDVDSSFEYDLAECVDTTRAYTVTYKVAVFDRIVTLQTLTFNDDTDEPGDVNPPTPSNPTTPSTPFL